MRLKSPRQPRRDPLLPDDASQLRWVSQCSTIHSRSQPQIGWSSTTNVGTPKTPRAIAASTAVRNAPFIALEPIAERVWLVHRRDQFRAHEHTVRQVEATSVEFKLWNVVDTLHGDETLTGVRLKHTQSGDFEDLECDVVLVNVGFKSSLGPIKEWGMTIEKNQIAVNPTSYETSLSRVFAVGDVATYPGKLKLIATGVGEAVTAVCFAKQALEPDAKLFPGHSSDRDE